MPGIELLGAAIGGALGNERVIEAGDGDCDDGRPNDAHDRLDFSGFIQSIDIDLGTTDRQVFRSATVKLKLTLSSSSALEGLLGSAFGDEIEGYSRDNFLLDLGDNDELYGDAGDDWLLVGPGKNKLEGGSGNNTILH